MCVLGRGVCTGCSQAALWDLVVLKEPRPLFTSDSSPASCVMKAVAIGESPRFPQSPVLVKTFLNSKGGR